jgi:hypothetical protein
VLVTHIQRLMEAPPHELRRILLAPPGAAGDKGTSNKRKRASPGGDHDVGDGGDDGGGEQPDAAALSYIYASANAGTADTLLVLVQGSGAVRPGQWARALCTNDSLRTGSVLPYLEEARARGWGILVLNPNMNTYITTDERSSSAADDAGDAAAAEADDEDEFHALSAGKRHFLATPVRRGMFAATPACATRRLIAGSTSPEQHCASAWAAHVAPAAAKHVVVVAHSYGGVCTVSLLAACADAERRTTAIAFTDSVHSTASQTVRQLLAQRGRNWQASDEPLNTPLSNVGGLRGCASVSAGHVKHEHTSAAAKESVFAFLDAKLAVAVAMADDGSSGGGGGDEGDKGKQ